MALRKRFAVSIAALAILGALVWTVAAASRPGAREIVLEARGMAYYLPGTATPNPEVAVAPGELVRITLVNYDRGMEHDVRFAGLDAATELVRGDGSRTSVRFRAPRERGRWAYLCTLHAQTMRGDLVVG